MSTFKTTTFLLILGFCAACSKSDGPIVPPIDDGDPKTPEVVEPFDKDPFEESDPYYYGNGGKIFLEQYEDKIFLKFTVNATKEQVRTLVGKVAASLHPVIPIEWDYYPPNAHNCPFALETISGKPVTSDVFDFLNSSPLVASVEYLYEAQQSILGLTDHILVRLKEGISHKLLLRIFEVNNCMVEGSLSSDKSANVYVSKTSEFNALQLSCLFYETGFFESSSPNFYFLNR